MSERRTAVKIDIIISTQLTHLYACLGLKNSLRLKLFLALEFEEIRSPILTNRCFQSSPLRFVHPMRMSYDIGAPVVDSLTPILSSVFMMYTAGEGGGGYSSR